MDIVHIVAREEGGPKNYFQSKIWRREVMQCEQSGHTCSGVWDPLKGPKSFFGSLMLKYEFSHILKTLFVSFQTSSSTPKTDKNRTLQYIIFQSIWDISMLLYTLQNIYIF